MYDPAHVVEVLRRHLSQLTAHGGSLTRRRILELGPGNSLGQSVLLVLLGAERVVAVDVRRYATERTGRGVYRQLVDGLEGWITSGDLASEIEPGERAGRANELLPAGATFPRLDGRLDYRILDSPALPLETGTIDFAYSESVLEHVADPGALYRELARVMRPGGICSHVIDLRDHHHPDPLDFLRYGDRLWSWMQGRSAGFTNRLRESDHLALIERAGFERLDLRRTRLEPPAPLPPLAPRFRAYPEEELRTLTLVVALRRRPEGGKAPRPLDPAGRER